MDEPLAVYPTRVDLPWDEVDGRVVIALPRRAGRVERLLSRVIPVPENVILSLEGGAAHLWRLADGTRTLHEAAREIAPHVQGERVEERTLHLAHDLARRGFLRLWREPRPVVETQRGLTPEKGFQRLACRRCQVVHPIRAKPGTRWFCPRCRRLNTTPPGPQRP